MRDSVPSVSYSSVCNVLRQWNISLIPTYRVYRLYDDSMIESTDSMIIMYHIATKEYIIPGLPVGGSSGSIVVHWPVLCVLSPCCSGGHSCAASVASTPAH